MSVPISVLDSRKTLISEWNSPSEFNLDEAVTRLTTLWERTGFKRLSSYEAKFCNQFAKEVAKTSYERKDLFSLLNHLVVAEAFGNLGRQGCQSKALYHLFHQGKALPLALHEEAAKVCLKLFQECKEMESSAAANLFQALPCIAAHPDLETAFQLLDCGLVHAKTDLDETCHLYSFVTVSGICQDVRDEALSCLLSRFLEDESEFDCKSELIDKLFPLLTKEFLTKAQKWEIISKCLAVLKESEDGLTIKKEIAKELSQQLWLLEEVLTSYERQEILIGLKQTLSLFSREDQIRILYSLFSPLHLFYRYGNFKPQTAEAVRPFFKECISDSALRLSVRKFLARQMPSMASPTLPLREGAVPLFLDMVKKMQEPSLPHEIKLIFTKHLVTCCKDPRFMALVEKQRPDVATLELLLAKPFIADHKELYEKAHEVATTL